jgi:ribosomal-protein-alanine N-acetyltransferase
LILPLILKSCVLREWQDSDVSSLVVNANNPNVARNLRDIFPSPYTVQHACEWLLLAKKLPPASNLAIEVHSQAVGGIGLRLVEGKSDAEIGFWLGEPFWNRGIITDALQAFTRHSFESFNLKRIHACVFSWNLSSCRVFEKCGYRNHGLNETRSRKGGAEVKSFTFSKERSAPPD